MRGGLERAANANPVNLLTVYLILLTLIPSTLVFAPLGGVGTPALVLDLLLLLWYLASRVSGGLVPSGYGRPILIATFIVAMTVLASFVASMTREISELEVLAADRGLITVLAWAGLVIVASQCFTSYDQLQMLMRRAVILGSVVAFIGVFEYYAGLNLTNYVHIPGLSTSVDINTLITRNGHNRPSSTAVQPIEFGVVMAMLLPFALHQAFQPAQSSQPARGNAVRAWGPVALISMGIAVSLSRSGIVGAIIAFLFLVPTWSPRRQRHFLAAAVLALGLLKVVTPGLLGTLGQYFTGLFGSSSSDVSVATRVADYAGTWSYIAARPLFGLGFGTFIPDLYRYTDNTYLLSLIETGFVGLGALLGLYLVGLHCAGAGKRRATDIAQREFGQALVASIAVGAVTSATFDSLAFPMFTGLLFLIFGLAGAYLGIMTATDSSADSLLGAIAAPRLPVNS